MAQGWFDGWLPGINDTTWGDAVALSFLSAVLEQHAQTNFLVGVMSRALDLQTHLQQEPRDPKAAGAAMGQGQGNNQDLRSYGDDDYVGGYNDGDAGNSGRSGGGGSNSKGTSTTTQKSSPSSRQPLPLSSKTKLSPGHMARLCSSSDLVWPTTPFLGTEGSGSLVGGAEGGEGDASFHATSAKSRAHRASSLGLLQPLAEGFSHLRHAVATSPSPDSAASSQSQSHGFFFDDDEHDNGGRDDGDGYCGDGCVERRRSGSGSSLPSFPIQLGRGGASANKQLRDLSFDSSEEEGFNTWKGSAAAATSSSTTSRSLPFRGSTHAQAASSEDGLISEESLTF